MSKNPGFTALAVLALLLALASCSSPMNTATDTKRPHFFPRPLADEWSQWIVGEWEGTGASDTGQGQGVERIEFALGGQFLICRGDAAISEDKMRVVQRTPMPDGSVMQEKGESVRRRPPGAAATDSPEVAAVKAFIAAINAQDLATLSMLMHEDHAFVDSEGTIVSGRTSVLAGWQRSYAMFPDYYVRVDSMVQHGAVGAVVFPDGAPLSFAERGPPFLPRGVGITALI